MPSALKCAQCGQLGAAYSPATIGALGLPSVRSSAVIVTFEPPLVAIPVSVSPPPRTYQAAPASAIRATTTMPRRTWLRLTRVSACWNGAVFGRPGGNLQSLWIVADLAPPRIPDRPARQPHQAEAQPG